MDDVFRPQLHAEITEAYDRVEILRGHHMVEINPELRHAVDRAKNALMQARYLTAPREES